MIIRLADLVDASAQRVPGAPALTAQATTISYADLRRRMEGAAAGLRELGLEAGEPGELVHRGPLVSLGYWNDPERTAERFRPPPNRPGELCTPELAVWSGDIVVKDRDGFLYFVGRRDEMIKTSGYRVSPDEIEEVAYETGLVRDAVALGLDDEELGQRIVLVVTPRDAQEFEPAAVMARLRQELPRYMVPADGVTRATLPRSPNGKFDRAALRRELR